MRRSTSILVLWFWLVTAAMAQVGQVVRELAETALEQLSQHEAGDLAKFGGEAAVREVFEKAVQEGGEEAAKQLARYTERFGIAALRAVEDAPGRMLPAFAQVGDDLLAPAVYAAAREPALVTRLVTQYGEDALVVVAKHPGVGSQITTSLGREGIDTALKIPTPQAIRLARYADDIAAAPIPSSSRKAVLDAVARAPGRVLDEIEKHPKIFMTVAGCATIVAISHDTKHEVFGDSEHPGFLDRTVNKFIDTFRTPISAVISLIGVGFLAWCGTRIVQIIRRDRVSKDML